MFSDYTDTISVRALLGVNDIELEDATILLPSSDLIISEGLLDLGASVLTMYATVAALSNRTASQTRFFEQVRLYSAALVASSLLGSLPMFASKKLTDSKAAFERVDDPYSRLAESLKGMLSWLRPRVLTSLLILDPGASVSAAGARRYASAVGLGTDPVTGV